MLLYKEGKFIILKNDRIFWSLNCVNVYACCEYLFFYNNIGSILRLEVSAMKKDDLKFGKLGAQKIFGKMSANIDVCKKICSQHGNSNQRHNKNKTFF